MSMRYEDFLSMPMEQMAEVVWSQGLYLTEKKYSNRFVELYALDKFFVEIWFALPQNIRDFNFVLIIKTFKKVKALDPYLFDEESFSLIKSY